jgi:hypothetical protein
MTAINQMTTPHPTPEERYEAACRRSESRFKGGGSAAYMLDVRNEIITAIREAEAAGEARGRANSILPNDDLLERCAELLRWYSSGELTGSAIRELANAIAPTLSTHSALRLAENRTHEDAMRFVVSFIRARTDKESSDD